MLQQARSPETLPQIVKPACPEVYRRVTPLELVQNWLEQEDSDLAKSISYGFLTMATLFMIFSLISYLIG